MDTDMKTDEFTLAKTDEFTLAEERFRAKQYIPPGCVLVETSTSCTIVAVREIARSDSGGIGDCSEPLSEPNGA